MDEFGDTFEPEDAFESEPELPPPPEPEREPPTDRMRLALIAVGSLIVVLLIALIVMLVADDDGSTVAADTSSTEATSTSETTAASARSEAPVVTAAPDVTEAPVATAAPDVTEAPVATAAPDVTEAETATAEVFLPSFVTADCITYDPNLLEIDVVEGAGALLRAGPAALLLYFDTIEEARVGFAVAGNHTELCRIGSDNTQADLFRYTHEFWRGDSGVIFAIPSPEDCISYDPTNLSIEDLGDNVWRLNSGPLALAGYDGEPDALAGMTLAEAYNEYCFIGRGNSRPDRFRYIHEYWK